MNDPILKFAYVYALRVVALGHGWIKLAFEAQRMVSSSVNRAHMIVKVWNFNILFKAFET